MDTKIQNTKTFDLEERTFSFAKNTREFIKKVPKTISNIEYVKQLIRSSSSVAANYIEANESLSKKDYYLRVRICRKEAKESRLWFRLLDVYEQMMIEQGNILIKETQELTRIFGAILEKQKK